MAERTSERDGRTGRGYTRRTALRAAGGVVTGGAGIPGRAGGRARTRYVAIGRPRRGDVPDRVARAGFSVERTFADGSVLLVVGPPGRRRRLGAVRGVVEAVRDRPLHRRGSEDSVDRITVPTGARPRSPVERQWDKAVTDAFDAHEVATGDGTTIAVIDSGVSADHPALEPNVNVDASRRVDGGQLYPARGRDRLGHGTFVAGVAAARGAGEGGVVGMAPDAEIVSVSPTLGGTALIDVVASMEYATAIGADVMNLSLGVTVDLVPRVERALRLLVDRYARRAYPQTATVVAAGNEGADASPGRGVFGFPASIRHALTVGATGPNDERTFYSTYGRGFVDVGAPGGGYETADKSFCADDGDGSGQITDDVDEPSDGVPGVSAGAACPLPAFPYPTNHVYGPVPPRSVIAGQRDGEGAYYGYAIGTSFAAPQVAGVIALVRDVAPAMAAQRIEQLVVETADPLPGASRGELGGGRTNAARAVEAARKWAREGSDGAGSR